MTELVTSLEPRGHETHDLPSEVTPSFHLTYQGLTGPAIGDVLGPGLDGEMWGVTCRHYDAELHQTRAGVVHLDSPETIRAVHALHDPDACRTCMGCGQVADDDDQTPWMVIEGAPNRTSHAVALGQVKALRCPDCKGTGKGSR